eukprot:CAMPEP_0168334832 /NCGR_PEP_ID=MMETSP0213-20121227/10532_1 /TAXON_ID=151035 /ORGANISM="Euplotes harpa, Strain FSP1.4" /LENGTH=64 /DNA_ID=CAMNT_0008339611 /DNA_START=335 /DNA_END=529 /DNA_ORIENTATION=-
MMSFIFTIVTKGFALGLTLYFLIQSNSVVNDQVSKFEFSAENKSVIDDLKQQIKNGNTALAILV